MHYLPDITAWDYRDLMTLPSGENDLYEYKSSKVTLDKLKNKISIAASAFWNAGGGVFIAGVDDTGKPDGGIASKNGRQDIRDWVDIAIKQTEPYGEYEINVIPISSDDSSNKVILVIKFNESNQFPHMAFDKKYYLRVGAHSEGANHFLVEALRAYRNIAKPYLKGLLRFHEDKPTVDELAIVSVNDATALDVKIDFNPYPEAIKKHFSNRFPLKIPLINKDNPFCMDIAVFGAREQSFGTQPISLVLDYVDVLGKAYHTEQTIHPQENLIPLRIGDDKIIKLTKAIEAVAASLKGHQGE